VRRNVASIDQVIYTWRHHGRRAALDIVRDRFRRARGKLHLSYQYPNVEWGHNVRIQGKLVIRGKGTVVIGDGVTLEGNHQPVRLIVPVLGSRIEIGQRTGMSGTVILAAGTIRIGRGCMLGQARISDNDWHPISGERRGAGTSINPETVSIEDNVWLGNGSMVLRGVKVGANSVVGAGAVVRTDVARDTVVIGNPQRSVRKLKATVRLDTSRVIELIETATQSIPGTIDPATRIDDPDLWDSLSTVMFLGLIQDETGLELTIEDLAGCKTAEQVAETIANRIGT